MRPHKQIRFCVLIAYSDMIFLDLFAKVIFCQSNHCYGEYRGLRHMKSLDKYWWHHGQQKRIFHEISQMLIFFSHYLGIVRIVASNEKTAHNFNIQFTLKCPYRHRDARWQYLFPEVPLLHDPRLTLPNMFSIFVSYPCTIFELNFHPLM